jgi:hypothetical protein
VAEFYDEVAKALGATALSPLRPGGQKRVFSAKRGSENVVLKAVEVLPPRQAEVLERASREVALLARVSSASGRRIVSVRSGLATVGNPAAPSAVGWLEEFSTPVRFTALEKRPAPGPPPCHTWLHLAPHAPLYLSSPRSPLSQKRGRARGQVVSVASYEFPAEHAGFPAR